MGNLGKGVSGVPHPTRMHQLIQLYLHSLFTLGAAVEKQDPVMTHYPQMKSLVITLAQNEETNIAFYDEVLSAINSHSNLKYGSKVYICSEVASMILA